MSKNIHVPIRNSTAEITGRLHKCLMSFPANAPIITEYSGLTAKNKSKHTAIPASPVTKVTASHGNASMTAIETAAHKMQFFFILIPHSAFDVSYRDELTYNTDTILSVMPEIPKTISSANSIR